MKDHYDFTGAVKGKYYRPSRELHVPLYLTESVAQGLLKLSENSGKNVEELANYLLTKDLEILTGIQA